MCRSPGQLTVRLAGQNRGNRRCPEEQGSNLLRPDGGLQVAYGPGSLVRDRRHLPELPDVVHDEGRIEAMMRDPWK